MKLFIKTADELCQIWLDQQKYEWQSGRELSKGLLRFLQQSLEKNSKTWEDLEAILVFRGPGSYTSLRIGLTVANTLAEALNIPIVGASGEAWREEALQNLPSAKAQVFQPVLPIYYQDAVITKPKK